MTNETARADASTIRVRRRLRTLTRCSREFFQAQSEQELLQSICQILVAGDDLRLAWVGYAEDDSGKTMRPVAKAGHGVDFLEQVKISWGDNEREQDPVGIAVQTSEAYRIDDIRADPVDSPWRSAAVAQGFAACIAFPLVAPNKRLGAIDLRGALGLYTAESGAFDDSAIECYAELATCLTHAVTVLRRDLAGDLSYDVTALRVTEGRKRAEDALRLARVELARVMQMTAVSQMAASIAHEINQPLAAIVAHGNAGLRWLARDPADLDEVRATLECIVKDGHHASEVIDGIRSMFKKQGQADASLDVNDLVREVLALLQGEIQSQQVTIKSELAEDLPQVPANRVQLQQVVVNLIMNAVDAMSAVADRARSLRVRTEVHEFNQLLITVEDSGTGIDPENVERVFDAFFTTKSHGMGMGLSICRSIVEGHGGRLTVSAGQPHGSIFHVSLPIGGVGGDTMT
jgi:C4-dicarboxylate-specific signal transduction histidine kinase